MIRLKAIAIFALSTALASAATTNPSTQPAVTRPTAADLEVHEWAVFVVDGSTGQLNPDGLVSATLPAFVNDHRYGSPSAPPVAAPVVNRRGIMIINGMVVQNGGNTTAPPVQTNADVDLPSPVGVIRLVGSVDSKVDVTIDTKAGAFVGSWPKAEERTNQLLWRDLSVGDQPAMPLNVTGPDNWITELRTGKSAYVSLEHVGSEKFLTYDLQMPYPSPLKVKEEKDFSIEVSNISGAALRDLTFYQGDGNNWHTVIAGDLAASKNPTATVATPAPPAAQVAGPQPMVFTSLAVPNGGTVILVPPVAPAAVVAATQPAVTATQPAATTAPAQVAPMPTVAGATPAVVIKSQTVELASTPVGVVPVTTTITGTIPTSQPTVAAVATQPTTAPAVATSAPSISEKFQLAVAPTTQPTDLANAWKPRMVAAGVDPVDANVIAKLIDQYAFDSHRLTAVYRMDDAEFDRILPIEVVPQPAKIKRFGLVIIVNADPSRGTAVDDLIVQLGDNEWAKRDAAYRVLAGMGPAATEKLRNASKNTDLEIAWRAERLLAMLPNGGK